MYATYADTLRRVLEHACQVSFPEALVQARTKTISSFAEKAARKFDRYPDAVNQMTDLCGARVIVQAEIEVEVHAAECRECTQAGCVLYWLRCEYSLRHTR
jgi:ppGpp synthetase/RelA/SpoT-type nucleotidyltranferase